MFHEVEGAAEDDVWDLAQMTMGCGRRADSLKMALTWVYHGKEGFEGRWPGGGDTLWLNVN